MRKPSTDPATTPYVAWNRPVLKPKPIIVVKCDERCECCSWLSADAAICMVGAMGLGPSPWETPETCPYCQALQAESSANGTPVLATCQLKGVKCEYWKSTDAGIWICTSALCGVHT